MYTKLELLKELEIKKKEVSDLEHKIQLLELNEEKENNKVEILKELTDFPRYYINPQGDIFHETGISINKFMENNIECVKLLDKKNNATTISVNSLLKKSF